MKRVHYQTFIWKKALEPCPVLSNPEGYGWHCEDDILKPKLATQQQVKFTDLYIFTDIICFLKLLLLTFFM